MPDSECREIDYLLIRELRFYSIITFIGKYECV